MTYVLSPLAAPFNPSGANTMYGAPDFEIAIFNDGVPEARVVGYDEESELLHGISDDAIDQMFPPSAQEVAEIEAAETFVSTMAALSFLEELEEEARHGFGHLRKRWETRRKAGLVGKPHHVRHVQDRDASGTHDAKRVHENKIVPFQHHCRDLAVTSRANRERAKEEARRMSYRASKKIMTMQVRKPIQQPRKAFL